jgi:RNA polymerase sigma factor (sigma-70 family)
MPEFFPISLDCAEKWTHPRSAHPYPVTVNRCNLEYRRAASEKTLHAGWTRHRAGSEVTNGGSGQAERNETIEVVRRHLSRLPPLLHALVVLRYFAELDSKEIGAILEIPHSTVRSRLRRARLQLAELLNDTR